MQLFCRLAPPSTLTAHPKKNVTFSKTRPGCRHANLVSTLGLTQCEPPPPKKCYNHLQKCWDTSTKKRPFLLQIAPGHSSVRYNTDFPPLSHSKLFLQVLSMVLYASNFDKGWRGDHKHKIMERPFMPKYGTVSQVLLQLVVATPPFLNLNMIFRNSAQKDFANIWQSKWVGVIAIEIERMEIHFLSDVFVAVTVVVS